MGETGQLRSNYSAAQRTLFPIALRRDTCQYMCRGCTSSLKSSISAVLGEFLVGFVGGQNEKASSRIRGERVSACGDGSDLTRTIRTSAWGGPGVRGLLTRGSNDAVRDPIAAMGECRR